MRKISIICRQLRTICRAFFAALLFLSIGPQRSVCEILPPETPSAAPPPPVEPSGSTRFDQKKQRRLDERARSKDAQEAQSKDTAEDAHRTFMLHRKFYGFSELTLHAAWASVSNGRSDYRADAGVHMSAYLRPFWSRDVQTLQPWLGLRVAPINGYGTQTGRTARFAHTWLGPALGFGRFIKPDDRESDPSPGHFLLISGGFAGVSRLMNSDEIETSPPRDFKPCAWCQDASGGWMEFRWTYLGDDVLGFGGLLGAQTGSGKVFTYTGLTVSGFY